jgi:hypothetical protein
MYTSKDGKKDKPYLLLNGSKIWGGTMSAPKHCGGDCSVNADLYQLGQIPFSDDIEVALKKKTGLFVPDYIIGGYRISPSEEGNVSHEVWFYEDGASYKLTYIITAVRAAFECDLPRALLKVRTEYSRS